MDGITIKVRCSGKLHRIIWHKGKLSFPDHPDIPARLDQERAFAALGGQMCRCAEVLALWRGSSHEWKKLPPELRKLRRELAERAAAQKLAFRFCRDPLTVPVRERMKARARAIATELLATCDYRRSRSRWAGGEHSIAVHTGEEPKARGYSTKAWSSNGKWVGTNSHLEITIVPAAFLRAYWRTGGIVRWRDGRKFMIVELNGDSRALVVAQARGFDVALRWCRIVRQSNGWAVVKVEK